MKQEASQNKMGYMPIPKLMLTMGLPMILSMVVQAFYNIVDSYFISNMTSDTIANLGDAAINALTLSFPIQMLMIAIGVGTGVGVNALLSKYLGEGNHKKASMVAGNAILSAIITYAIFLLFGFFGVSFFLRSQTSDALILDLGITYLSICTIFSFGAIGAMIYEKLLQSTGKTNLSTIAQLAGAITNIVLDPVLIFGMLGCPQLGVAGAAIATIIGQILTLGLDMYFHYRKNTEIDGSLSYLKPEKQTLLGIYKVGAPAILMQALMSFMSYGVNIIFGVVSAAAVTAFGIYYKIQQFVFFAAFGINNAIIPILAFNYGRADKKRMQEGIRFGLLFTLALMLMGMLLLQVFATQLCAIFSLSTMAQELCMNALRIVTLGYLFAGANIAYQGIFQALGYGVKSLILSMIRLVIVTLPLAWFFTSFANAGQLIWLSFPIGELCGFLIALCFMRQIRRTCILPLPDTPKQS